MITVIDWLIEFRMLFLIVYIRIQLLWIFLLVIMILSVWCCNYKLYLHFEWCIVFLAYPNDKNFGSDSDSEFDNVS